MKTKFEVPEGYEELLLVMAKRELAYLKDRKSTGGIHFTEDNFIHQLKTFIGEDVDMEAKVSAPVWSKPETYN